MFSPRIVHVLRIRPTAYEEIHIGSEKRWLSVTVAFEAQTENPRRSLPANRVQQ